MGKELGSDGRNGNRLTVTGTGRASVTATPGFCNSTGLPPVAGKIGGAPTLILVASAYSCWHTREGPLSGPPLRRLQHAMSVALQEP